MPNVAQRKTVWKTDSASSFDFSEQSLPNRVSDCDRNLFAASAIPAMIKGIASKQATVSFLVEIFIADRTGSSRQAAF